MPMLTLVDVLAIESPTREPLVEADDVLRDLASAVESAAARDGLDPAALARALVGVLTAAAARQAMIAYPAMSQGEIGAGLARLVEESVAWAFRRALGPATGDPERDERRRVSVRKKGRRGDAA